MAQCLTVVAYGTSVREVFRRDGCNRSTPTHAISPTRYCTHMFADTTLSLIGPVNVNQNALEFGNTGSQIYSIKTLANRYRRALLLTNFWASCTIPGTYTPR